MSDDVEREVPGAIRQPRLEYDAPTPVASGRRAGQPDIPPFAGHEIIECDSKPRILQEIKLNLVRESKEHGEETLL